MDKEKDYVVYLINKKKYINEQIIKLYQEKNQIDSRLQENLICPECFNQLQEEKFADVIIVSCSNCEYENGISI